MRKCLQLNASDAARLVSESTKQKGPAIPQTGQTWALMSQLLSQDGSDEAQATPETLNEEYFPGRNTERKTAAPLNLLSEVTASSECYFGCLIDKQYRSTC